MRKLIILFFLPYLLISNDYNEQLRTRTGFWYGLNYNIHNLKDFQFNELWNCCPEMKNAYGTGKSIGTFLELPLSNDLYFGLRSSYKNLYGIYEKKIWDNILNFGNNVLYNQKLLMNLSTIGIDMYLSGYFYDDYYFNAGYKISYFNNKEYEYNYQSVDNLNVLEINSKKGHFKELSEFLFSLEFALGYEFSLDEKERFKLSPEITYSTALFDIYPETYWKINSLGLNLKFIYAPEYVETVIREVYIYDTIVVYKPDIKKEYLKYGKSESSKYEQKEGKYHYLVTEIKRIDTLIKPLSPLKPKFKVLGLMPSGKSQPIKTILMKAELHKQVNSVLPFIFFDKFSSELPERYFNVGDLEINHLNDCNASLCYNRNILNIVADHLFKYPESSVVLKGYVDLVTEGKDCQLAIERAKSVKNKLLSLGISPDRIIIDSSGPCHGDIANARYDDKRYEENQKVLLKVNSEHWMEPIASDWYLEANLIIPEKLIFDISENDWERIKSWLFRLRFGDYELFYVTGTDVRETIEFTFSGKEMNLLNNNDALYAEFLVQDKYGDQYLDTGHINVLIDTAKYQYSSFNIVLFDYSNFVLTKEIRDNLVMFLKELDGGSELYIYGYTDILGDDEYNRKLAKARAFQTAYHITQINPRIKISSVVGYATEKFAPGIQSYDTPEERILSRMVEIQIRSNRK